MSKTTRGRRDGRPLSYQPVSMAVRVLQKIVPAAPPYQYRTQKLNLTRTYTLALRVEHAFPSTNGALLFGVMSCLAYASLKSTSVAAEIPPVLSRSKPPSRISREARPVRAGRVSKFARSSFPRSNSSPRTLKHREAALIGGLCRLKSLPSPVLIFFRDDVHQGRAGRVPS